MNERIFNVFLFISDGIIRELGGSSHEVDGSDEEKLLFLQSHVDTDVTQTRRFAVPDRYRVVRVGGGESASAGLRYEMFQDLQASGRHIELFDDVFEALGATEAPFVCITPIVDLFPRVDEVTEAMTGPDTVTMYMEDRPFSVPAKWEHINVSKLREFIGAPAFLPVEIGKSTGEYSAWGGGVVGVVEGKRFYVCDLDEAMRQEIIFDCSDLVPETRARIFCTKKLIAAWLGASATPTPREELRRLIVDTLLEAAEEPEAVQTNVSVSFNGEEEEVGVFRISGAAFLGLAEDFVEFYGTEYAHAPFLN